MARWPSTPAARVSPASAGNADRSRLQAPRPLADGALLGSADVQSLADLGNAYDSVRGMRVVPVTRDAALRLGAAVIVPIVPLALTMMPLEELLRKLLALLF